ncbi:N-acetylated-alpha-linked acidic dipeptidase 2-like [Strongylocentrotus purpuratus]|uniref:Peptidase M28 domain-containing protein n=1 Tax=Strongylocentrotus purpuratus TaxID=7668 RepID=A0A7M7T5C1_STRPU|nr:N-acetylated-alpha-linked acidic dipeptidase 2-like [Strongylocentrotus purpuratus]
MYRLNDSDTSLPTIPVHPIGYGDAQHLLSELGGDEVQDTWKGGLNITYRYGPGFTNPNRKVKMSIHTSREIRTIYNVIGVINGAVEPDRYVLLGNHRDAWVYGAVDPSSGTAVLMESARVYSQMIKKGWRPRRSVMFCSWGAEEYGLLGSTEFVEEYQKILGERAVAYINIDSAVVGNYSFVAKATPLLQQAIMDATKKASLDSNLV